MNKFQSFLFEQNEKKISPELKLTPDAQVKPFIVDEHHHPNLRPIIKAFLNSNNVFLPGPSGYPSKLTIIDSNKGTIHPKLKKKNLFLTGGAVRDHIKNKTPRDYDLATNATPDEIRLILSNANFIEVKPKNSKSKKYNNLPEDKKQKKVFYVDTSDKSNKEYSFIIRVNDEEFEIATFRKNPKGSIQNDKVLFSSLEDDASSRDFTINSMYIPLNNPDGPNSKLIDPNGGIHHVTNSQLNFIGDAKERLDEDQLRALRYIRFSAINGQNELPENIIELFKKNDLSKIEKKAIREEFFKGLQHADVDVKKYIKMYKDSGLLHQIFKNVNFNDELLDEKDKKLSIAWLLKNNPRNNVFHSIKDLLDPKDSTEILYLLDLKHWINNFSNPNNIDNFYNLKEKLNSKIHIVPSIFEKWANMNNLNNNVLNKFLNYKFKIKKYIEDDCGNQMLNPEIYIPNNEMPTEDIINNTIKQMENKEFQKYLNDSI